MVVQTIKLEIICAEMLSLVFESNVVRRQNSAASKGYSPLVISPATTQDPNHHDFLPGQLLHALSSFSIRAYL